MPALAIMLRRTATAALGQAARTLKRPSRLLLVPVVFTIRVLSRSPRLLQRLVALFPTGRWLNEANRRAVRLAVADNLFQSGFAALALEYLQRTLRADSISIDEYLLRGLCLFQGLGRFRDAMSLWQSANEFGSRRAQTFGLADCPFRVLDGAWARHIGDTAMLDYVIKLGVLEGRKREDTILYLPRGSPVANRFLLQQLAQGLRLIEQAADLPFDPAALQALHYDMIGPRLPDGRTGYCWDMAARTYRQWQDAGKSPLLQLPADVAARGWATLQRAGMPHGAWFVALHVREGRRGGRHAGLHGIRNADIATYLPALAEITARGGCVIRLGDPAMTPLPPLPKVIDYCRTEWRADWMDIFLLASCRFMIGTISGPNFVPALYGRPAAPTNWWPPAQRPFHESDIFLPKTLRKVADSRLFTLSESLREPFSYCHSRRHLADREGVRVEDNEPELIRSAVVEMLERLDGNLEVNSEVAELRARSERVYQAHGAGGTSALAAGFLLQHAALIA